MEPETHRYTEDTSLRMNAADLCPGLSLESFAEENSCLTYSSYLTLDVVLSAQHPLSSSHDEMLFIVQHQTSELWMKLALHELHAGREALQESRIHQVCKIFARLTQIMNHLVRAWDILTTLTPSEYLSIRPHLATSTGFQSHQYREIEFLLGNKNAAVLEKYKELQIPHQQLEKAFHECSVYDEVVFLLKRRGFPIDPHRLERDWERKNEENASVQAAWAEIYRQPEKHWDLYELGEKLVDLEDSMRLWRFRHVLTVERIIGFKKGTGHSTGVPYLRKAIDRTFFPDLLDVRTTL